MTVRQLLASIDSRELSEWIAYERIDPFGQDRADLRTGIVCATIANSNPYRGEGPASQPKDFMPFVEREPPKQQSAEEQIAIAQAIAKAMGAKPPTPTP